MISNAWLYLIAIMIGGSILKNLVFHPVAWVAIDILVFAACWFLLRRYPYVDMRRTLMLLGGLTVVNVLADLGLIGAMTANIIVLAFIAWMIFGGRGSGGGPRTNLRHKWHK